ncbi:hypothetical protein HDE_09408 [Halotydeus destructor]|nr:hypothetical protein HDE_09408 [Halotydeus destructor]
MSYRNSYGDNSYSRNDNYRGRPRRENKKLDVGGLHKFLDNRPVTVGVQYYRENEARAIRGDRYDNMEYRNDRVIRPSTTYGKRPNSRPGSRTSQHEEYNAAFVPASHAEHVTEYNHGSQRQAVDNCVMSQYENDGGSHLVPYLGVHGSQDSNGEVLVRRDSRNSNQSPTESRQSRPSSGGQHLPPAAFSIDLRKPMECTDTFVKAKLAFVRDPGMFYVVLERDEEDVRRIEQELENANGRELTSPKRNYCGYAKVPTGNQGFKHRRVQVIFSDYVKRSTRVKAIDYGTVAVVDRCYVLPDSSRMIPAAAIQCSLVDSDIEFCPEEVEQFKLLNNDKLKLVRFIKPIAYGYHVELLEANSCFELGNISPLVEMASVETRELASQDPIDVIVVKREDKETNRGEAESKVPKEKPKKKKKSRKNDRDAGHGSPQQAVGVHRPVETKRINRNAPSLFDNEKPRVKLSETDYDKKNVMNYKKFDLPEAKVTVNICAHDPNPARFWCKINEDGRAREWKRMVYDLQRLKDTRELKHPDKEDMLNPGRAIVFFRNSYLNRGEITENWTSDGTLYDVRDVDNGRTYSAEKGIRRSEMYMVPSKYGYVEGRAIECSIPSLTSFPDGFAGRNSQCEIEIKQSADLYLVQSMKLLDDQQRVKSALDLSGQPVDSVVELISNSSETQGQTVEEGAVIQPVVSRKTSEAALDILDDSAIVSYFKVSLGSPAVLKPSKPFISEELKQEDCHDVTANESAVDLEVRTLVTRLVDTTIAQVLADNPLKYSTSKLNPFLEKLACKQPSLIPVDLLLDIASDVHLTVSTDGDLDVGANVDIVTSG